MENKQFSEQIRARRTLRIGTRTAIIFESETPAQDTPPARHAQVLAKVLCEHAAREYLPVAEGELARLAEAGRGYAFLPHHVRFCARIRKVRARMRLELTLRYSVGKEERLVQRNVQIWCASGAYRLK